ncbi:MAG: lysophospholipid acyltransferase family protein [Oscillospiraceae bacterium]
MLFFLFIAVGLVASALTCTLAALWQGVGGVLLFLLLSLGYFLLCVGLWVVFIFLLSCTVDQEKPAGKQWRLWRHLIEDTLDLLLRVLRVRIRVTGLEKIPTDSRFLFTCNHITIYDPLVSLVALRKYDVTFISKKENFKKLMIGNLMHAAGILSIDRENDRSAVRTILEAVRLLKEDRTSIALYPEGYCRRDPSLVLQPFRDGSLKIAQKAKVPVVVSTIRGTEETVRGFFHRLYTEVHLDILAVVPAEEVCAGTTHELGEKIWQVMYDHLAEGAPTA